MIKNLESLTVKLIGNRLLAEANDLKRTIDSISKEICVDISKFENVIDGYASFEEAVELATQFSQNYPVSLGDLIIDLPDHADGVLIMRAEESKKSARVFKRKDSLQKYTDYYEYRDTATSNISPFKPEWIKELRYVDNSDPENPDVAYNNGHFLHQMTAFIGPVNFYWEIDGKKYSSEMNTGDSNYITPFWKHSFATRSKNEDAIIIAVTFAGNAARARKEMYHLNKNAISNYFLDNRNNINAKALLLKQILDDRCINSKRFDQICKKNSIDLNSDSITDGDKIDDISLVKVCEALDISPAIFDLPNHTLENEVVIKKKDSNESYILNDNTAKPDYKVSTLAHNKRMPQMFGFEFEILGNELNSNTQLKSSLHSYIYNFGDNPVNFSWVKENDNKDNLSDKIMPGDSIYVEPFVKHAFSSIDGNVGKLFIFRVSGAVSLEVQKEISSFAATDRLIESSQWFD